MAKEYTDDELAKWFRDKATSVKTGSARNKLLSAESRYTDIDNELVGNMYFFRYDPKFKSVLPMYDKYPLVIIIERYNDGFLGLNMHYLAYPLRVKLLDRLQQFRNNDKMDGTTKLKLQWALIDGVSRFSLAKPCVKEYLLDHVRSQFVKINSRDWGTAMLLPVERFVGSSKDVVWRESLGKI